MGVTANITVSFGSKADCAEEAGTHLSAEIDGRETGLNNGETSFAPGDTAHFLVYKSANVTYNAPITSGGTIGSGGALAVNHEEFISFADTDTASLSVPVASLGAITWFGNSLGALTLGEDKMTLKASAKGVAVARVNYTANADAYSLTSPATLGGETDFSILVFLLGQVTPQVPP
jgi:hypothetical protein